MTTRIDTLEVSKVLKSFGFSKEQSEGLPKVLLSLIDDAAATKADIMRLEAAIKTEVSRLEGSLSQTASMIRTEMAALEHRMTARVYGGQIAAVVAVIGALKLFGMS